ncbi:MAG: hypothetical protein JSW10_06845 [Pseudomonadota bacterium]|nr:MAG: hypothetical protein JSW10_06845 [Pseudomonadota bacterium]
MNSSPTSASLYLAIDQGGHASRAAVFDHAGNMVARACQPISETRPRAGWVEQDPLGLLASVRRCVAAVANRLEDRWRDVRCAGLATQRASVCCWDRENGAPLTPVLSWQDRRAHEWLDALGADAAMIRARTGLMLSAHYGATKLRWCLDHLPAARTAQRRQRLGCGPLATFLLRQLLHEHGEYIDPANASRTLLWNIESGEWDPRLLALFGIAREVLPMTVPTRFDFGHLVHDQQRIPLTVVTGDQSAAVFAWGAPRNDTVYINIGSGAFVSWLTHESPPQHDRLLHSVVYRDTRTTWSALEGTVNGAATAIDVVARQLGRDPQHVLDALPGWLDTVKSPPLFLNTVSGLGAPWWVPDLSERFIGGGDVAARMVAVVESIAFLTTVIVEELCRVQPGIARIMTSGGLAKLGGLCSRLATLCELPVERPAESEATARGLACLLAGCPDSWRSANHATVFAPVPDSALQSRYARWRENLETAIAEHRSQGGPSPEN